MFNISSLQPWEQVTNSRIAVNLNQHSPTNEITDNNKYMKIKEGYMTGKSNREVI